jgi:hypothetical protein
VWCKLETVRHKTVYLSTYYKPKTSNEESFDEYKTSIERASSIKNTLIISAWDFNLPGWDWYTKYLKSNSQCVRIHNKFMDTVDDYGLTQLVTQPTRGPNTLDLILTNSPSSFGESNY